MKKAISVETLQQSLINQRTCMLALANTSLTEYQVTVLALLYAENEILVNLFGITVPSLQSLVKSHNEIIYLETLYQNSHDKRNEIKTQQEIDGISRVDHVTVGSIKTL